MSEGVSGNYLVRDPQGNIYGPADAQMLRAWVQQGRIVAGMAIAAKETREWIDASAHPAVADLLAASSGSAVGPHYFGPPGTSTLVPAQAYPLTPQLNAGYLPPRHNLLGLLSLIFSVMSILFLCAGACAFPITGPISGLLAIAAITLGFLGISQAKSSPGAYVGSGMAVGGVAVGIVALALILMATAMLFFFSMAHS